MTQETPEVLARRLRAYLRQARQSAGLTQQAVAAELYWSISKLIRIEAGTVPVAPTDVRAMLMLYGITDSSDLRAMTDLAIRSRSRTKYAEYRDVFSPSAMRMFANEEAAKVIHKYEPNVIPGLLQTEEYCRALLDALVPDREVARRRLEARLERQQMLWRPRHPRIQFIIGEAALSYSVGGSAVMRAQLNHLRALSDAPDISIRVLPFAAGPHRSLGAAFTVLLFDDPGLGDLLYFEDQNGDDAERDDLQKIDLFLGIFAELESIADDTGNFGEFIDGVIARRFSDESAVDRS